MFIAVKYPQKHIRKTLSGLVGPGANDMMNVKKKGFVHGVVKDGLKQDEGSADHVGSVTRSITGKTTPANTCITTRSVKKPNAKRITFA